MIIQVLILAFLNVSLQQILASSECRASNVKFTVRSYKNQTGHWITKLQVDNAASSSDAYEEGELQTGHWTVNVDQSNRECNSNSDSMSLAATITAPPALAGPGYELFTGIGRYKFHTTPKTWDEARTVCAREGAHLAITNSEEECKVLQQLFALHPENTLQTTNKNNIFIGYYDVYKDGHFVTIFGEPLNQTGFTRWARPGEPNNAGGNEYCGSIHRNGGLNDIPCDYKLAFICEQELF